MAAPSAGTENDHLRTEARRVTTAALTTEQNARPVRRRHGRAALRALHGTRQRVHPGHAGGRAAARPSRPDRRGYRPMLWLGDAATARVPAGTDNVTDTDPPTNAEIDAALASPSGLGRCARRRRRTGHRRACSGARRTSHPTPAPTDRLRRRRTSERSTRTDFRTSRPRSRIHKLASSCRYASRVTQMPRLDDPRQSG